uniref:Branched-chain-amino-acid aminotransferase 3ic-like isoform X1 n=1 Tax=Rhizophora mucronata TaxID=61149 RepID=A0A2P2P7X2_RHIMU
MRMGVERTCLPSPSQAICGGCEGNSVSKQMLGKGSLYIRPLLVVSRAVLGLAAAPKYTFLIYVSPFGNCFKSGMATW